MHASCESPWYLSAKHHVLEACFLLMGPFRTRFSPCEMVRTANVQRLRGCLYTLRYCYILTCRLVTAQLPLPIPLLLPHRLQDGPRGHGQPGHPDPNGLGDGVGEGRQGGDDGHLPHATPPKGGAGGAPV